MDCEKLNFISSEKVIEKSPEISDKIIISKFSDKADFKFFHPLVRLTCIRKDAMNHGENRDVLSQPNLQEDSTQLPQSLLQHMGSSDKDDPANIAVDITNASTQLHSNHHENEVKLSEQNQKTERKPKSQTRTRRYAENNDFVTSVAYKWSKLRKSTVSRSADIGKKWEVLRTKRQLVTPQLTKDKLSLKRRKCVAVRTKKQLLSENQSNIHIKNIHKSIDRLPTSSRIAYLSRQKYSAQRNIKPNFLTKSTGSKLLSANATLHKGRPVTHKQKDSDERRNMPQGIKSKQMSKQRSEGSKQIKSTPNKSGTLTRNRRKKSRLKLDGIQDGSRVSKSTVDSHQQQDGSVPAKRKRGRPPKHRQKHLKNIDATHKREEPVEEIDSSKSMVTEKEEEKHAELTSNDSIHSQDLQNAPSAQKQGRTVCDLMDETGNTLPQSVLTLAESISNADSEIKISMLPPLNIQDSTTPCTGSISYPVMEPDKVPQTHERHGSSLQNDESINDVNVTHSASLLHDLHDTRTFDKLEENDPVCLTPPGSNECMSTTSDDCIPSVVEELSHSCRTNDINKSIESSPTNQVPESSNKENGATSDSVFPMPSLQQLTQCDDSDKNDVHISYSINTLDSGSTEIKTLSKDGDVEKPISDESCTKFTDEHEVFEESVPELQNDDLSQIRIVKTVTLSQSSSETCPNAEISNRPLSSEGSSRKERENIFKALEGGLMTKPKVSPLDTITNPLRDDCQGVFKETNSLKDLTDDSEIPQLEAYGGANDYEPHLMSPADSDSLPVLVKEDFHSQIPLDDDDEFEFETPSDDEQSIDHGANNGSENIKESDIPGLTNEYVRTETLSQPISTADVGVGKTLTIPDEQSTDDGAIKGSEYIKESDIQEMPKEHDDMTVTVNQPLSTVDVDIGESATIPDEQSTDDGAIRGSEYIKERDIQEMTKEHHDMTVTVSQPLSTEDVNVEETASILAERSVDHGACKSSEYIKESDTPEITNEYDERTVTVSQPLSTPDVNVGETATNPDEQSIDHGAAKAIECIKESDIPGMTNEHDDMTVTVSQPLSTVDIKVGENATIVDNVEDDEDEFEFEFETPDEDSPSTGEELAVPSQEEHAEIESQSTTLLEERMEQDEESSKHDRVFSDVEKDTSCSMAETSECVDVEIANQLVERTDNSSSTKLKAETLEAVQTLTVPSSPNVDTNQLTSLENSADAKVPEKSIQASEETETHQIDNVSNTEESEKDLEDLITPVEKNETDKELDFKQSEEDNESTDMVLDYPKDVKQSAQQGTNKIEHNNSHKEAVKPFVNENSSIEDIGDTVNARTASNIGERVSDGKQETSEYTSPVHHEQDVEVASPAEEQNKAIPCENVEPESMEMENQISEHIQSSKEMTETTKAVERIESSSEQEVNVAPDENLSHEHVPTTSVSSEETEQETPEDLPSMETVVSSKVQCSMPEQNPKLDSTSHPCDSVDDTGGDALNSSEKLAKPTAIPVTLDEAPETMSSKVYKEVLPADASTINKKLEDEIRSHILKTGGDFQSDKTKLPSPGLEKDLESENESKEEEKSSTDDDQIPRTSNPEGDIGTHTAEAAMPCLQNAGSNALDTSNTDETENNVNEQRENEESFAVVREDEEQRGEENFVYMPFMGGLDMLSVACEETIGGYDEDAMSTVGSENATFPYPLSDKEDLETEPEEVGGDVEPPITDQTALMTSQELSKTIILPTKELPTTNVTPSEKLAAPNISTSKELVTRNIAVCEKLATNIAASEELPTRNIATSEELPTRNIATSEELPMASKDSSKDDVRSDQKVPPASKWAVRFTKKKKKKKDKKKKKKRKREARADGTVHHKKKHKHHHKHRSKSKHDKKKSDKLPESSFTAADSTDTSKEFGTESSSKAPDDTLTKSVCKIQEETRSPKECTSEVEPVNVQIPQPIEAQVPHQVEETHHSPEIIQATVILPPEQPALQTVGEVGTDSSVDTPKEKNNEVGKEMVIVVSDNEDENLGSCCKDPPPESEKAHVTEESSVKKPIVNIVLSSRISLPEMEQNEVDKHLPSNKNSGRIMEVLPKYVQRAAPVGSTKALHSQPRAKLPQQTTFFGSAQQQQQNPRQLRMNDPFLLYPHFQTYQIQSPEHGNPRYQYLPPLMTSMRPHLQDHTGSCDEIRNLLTNKQTASSSKNYQKDFSNKQQQSRPKRTYSSPSEDFGGKRFLSSSGIPGESLIYSYIPSQNIVYSGKKTNNGSNENKGGNVGDPQHQLDHRQAYTQKNSTIPMKNVPSSQPMSPTMNSPQMAKSPLPLVPEAPHLKQQSKDPYRLLPPHLATNALRNVPVFTVPGEKEQLIPIYPSQLPSKSVGMPQGPDHHKASNRSSPRAPSTSPRAMSNSPRINQSNDPETNLNLLKRLHSETYQNTHEHHPQTAAQLCRMPPSLPINQTSMSYFQRRASRSTNSSPSSTTFSPPPAPSPHGLPRIYVLDTIAGTPLDTGRSSRSPQVSTPKSRSTPSASPHVIEEERLNSRPPSSNTVSDHPMSSGEDQPLDLTCKEKFKLSISSESEEPNPLTSLSNLITAGSFTNSSNEIVSKTVQSSKRMGEIGIDLSKTSKFDNLPPSVDPQAKNVEYFAQWISSSSSGSQNYSGENPVRPQQQHFVQHQSGTRDSEVYTRVESEPNTSAVSIDRADVPVAYNELMRDGLISEGPGLAIDKSSNPNLGQDVAVGPPLLTLSRPQDLIIPSTLSSQIPLMELKRAPTMPFPQAPILQKQQLSTSSSIAVHQTPPAEIRSAESHLVSSHSDQSLPHSEEACQRPTSESSNEVIAESTIQEPLVTREETIQQPSVPVGGMEHGAIEYLQTHSKPNDADEKQGSPSGSECGESVSQESEVPCNVSVSSENSVSSLKRSSASSDLTQCPKKRFMMTHEAVLTHSKPDESCPSMEQQTSSSDDDSSKQMDYPQAKVMVRDVMSSHSIQSETDVVHVEERNALSLARRKRGRPKGSRNAEKEAKEKAEENASYQQCTFCEFRSKSRQEIRVHSKEKHFAKHITKHGKHQHKDAAVDDTELSSSADKTLKRLSRSEGTTEDVEKQHVGKERKSDVHVCRYCSSTFTELSLLLEHQTSVHLDEGHEYSKNKNNICELCGHTEKSPGPLVIHINKKHGKELGSGRCAFQDCSREFGTINELKDHLNEHWIVKKYACRICGVRYQVLNSLKAHLERHKQELPNLCKVCKLSFKTQGTLIRHQKQRGHLPKS